MNSRTNLSLSEGSMVLLPDAADVAVLNAPILFLAGSMPSIFDSKLYQTEMRGIPSFRL